MKVFPFKIPKQENEALVFQEERSMVLYNQLHQHSEIQISYIQEGSGTLLVGETINDYNPNDIIVIGGYLPHVFRSETNASEVSVVYNLFFNKNSFGSEFFDLPDLKSTNLFFNRAEYGMKILSKKRKIIKQFRKLKNKSKIEQVSILLKILNYIDNSEFSELSSFLYKNKYSDDEGKRMSKVFDFALENYFEPITLEDIAAHANMSKNAFCRYFKKRTNKTFFQFLIEIRIENACKFILKNPDWAISYVSEQSGFNNVAHFNRKFKEIKGVTPSEFKLQRF